MLLNGYVRCHRIRTNVDETDRCQIAKNAKSLGVSLEKGFILGGESAGADLALGVAYLYGKEKLSPPLTGVYSSVSSAATAETIPEKYRSRFLSVEQNAFAPMIMKESLQLIRGDVETETGALTELTM